MQEAPGAKFTDLNCFAPFSASECVPDLRLHSSLVFPSIRFFCLQRATPVRSAAVFTVDGPVRPCLHGVGAVSGRRAYDI